MPASALEMVRCDAGALAATRVLAPMRMMGSMREASDVIEQIGIVHGVSVACLCAPGHTSLASRVVDAVGMVQSVLGDAESVHAAWVGSRGGGADRLRAHAGTLTANLKFPGERVATIIASDRASTWCRSATLLADRGQMIAQDRSFTWHHADGALGEEWRDAGVSAGDPAMDAIAESLARHLTSGADDAPGDLTSILVLCQCILLSARTGNCESVATMRRMLELG
jgi:hypothetical protein